MVIEKTMSHVEREIYENEIGQLRRAIGLLQKCCVQREGDRLPAEIERLRVRLEIRDDGSPDGIECRDETIKMQDAEIDRLEEENYSLKSLLKELVELAEYWINQGIEPDFSHERYETWLALGHKSVAMRKAKNMLKENYYD